MIHDFGLNNYDVKRISVTAAKLSLGHSNKIEFQSQLQANEIETILYQI